jgi:hypothetical protein
MHARVPQGKVRPESLYQRSLPFRKKGSVMIFHILMFYFHIDTTFSTSSTYVTYVQRATGKAKKERKREIIRRVNFVVARVDVELMCVCAQPVIAAQTAAIPRFCVSTLFC